LINSVSSAVIFSVERNSCRSLKQLMDRLQSVQNTAAPLIFRARRYDHMLPLLRSLHWPRVLERISFWLAVLVYRCLNDSAPGYLASDIQRVSDLGGCARRRSSPHSPCVLPSATEPSQLLLHLFGTVCRRQYVHRRHYQFSAED